MFGSKEVDSDCVVQGDVVKGSVVAGMLDEDSISVVRGNVV